MSIYIAIALGGSLGAICRYWVATATYTWLGNNFPYGTLMVNVSGSLLMGFLTVVLVQRFDVSAKTMSPYKGKKCAHSQQHISRWFW